MPKKKSSSLKKQSQEAAEPAVEETKPVSKPGKIGIEIDEIFGGRKKKKPEQITTETKEEIAKKKRKMKRKRNELGGSNNNNNNNKPEQTRPRKRTEEGLPVFTADELGINKPNAGDTPLCPFDCDCCF